MPRAERVLVPVCDSGPAAGLTLCLGLHAAPVPSFLPSMMGRNDYVDLSGGLGLTPPARLLPGSPGGLCRGLVCGLKCVGSSRWGPGVEAEAEAEAGTEAEAGFILLHRHLFCWTDIINSDS